MRCDQSKNGPDTGLLDLDGGVREGRGTPGGFILLCLLLYWPQVERGRGRNFCLQVEVWLGEYCSGEGSKLWVYVGSAQGLVPGWGGVGPRLLDQGACLERQVRFPPLSSSPSIAAIVVALGQRTGITPVKSAHL